MANPSIYIPEVLTLALSVYTQPHKRKQTILKAKFRLLDQKNSKLNPNSNWTI